MFHIEQGKKWPFSTLIFDGGGNRVAEIISGITSTSFKNVTDHFAHPLNKDVRAHAEIMCKALNDGAKIFCGETG